VVFVIQPEDYNFQMDYSRRYVISVLLNDFEKLQQKQKEKLSLFL